MPMIFIGGSNDIIALPEHAIERIGSIVTAEHGVLIGGAPGADAEMQGLLMGYGYGHVGVFCAGDKPRKNLGDWTVYRVPPPEGVQGFAVHAAKDREMARRADYGLMIWDCESPGTVFKVLRLAMANKPCVTYDMMRGRVATTYDIAGWRAIFHNAGPGVRQQVEARMTRDERLALPA
jgi:hypothetical protein